MQAGNTRRSPSQLPWQLSGSAVVLLSRCTFRGTCPRGGTLLALVRYDSSPVGPYHEIAAIALTRRGFSVIEMEVDSASSRHWGRENWGFPKEVAPLAWRREGPRVRFEAAGRVWRVRACGPVFSLRLIGATSQCRDGMWVRVPVLLRGRARLGFCGKRLALVLEEFQMHVGPAL